MTGQQLKNSILQWAIQGKLVPQDPTDEPASELLECIRTEKAQLIKKGKIKKGQPTSHIYRDDEGSYYEKVGSKDPVCINHEIPFDLPSSWEWCRLGDMVKMRIGKTPPRYNSQYWVNGLFPWVAISDMTDYGVISSTKEEVSKQAIDEVLGDISPAGTLLMSFKLTIGRTSILEIDAFHNEAIISIFPFVDVEFSCRNYLFYILPFVSKSVESKGAIKGKTLNSSSLHSLLIPLPPLEEQKRIVARIEELMPLVEQYDKAHSELTRLNDQLPEQLKKSILQEAIQGKLVPQDPTDEPASELLERIRTEKAQLIKEGKMKKGQPTSHIYRDDEGSYYEKVGTKDPVCINHEIPFDLPASWEWCRLSDIAVYIQRGKSPKYSLIKKYPVVAQKCNQWDGFLIDKAKFIDPATLSKYTPERFLQDEDLMWNSTGLGTLGRMAVYYTALNPYELAVADSHVTVIRLLKSCVDPSFCYFYFINPTVQSVIENMSDGSTKQRELSTTTVRNFLVPLPPLEEQKRIVARIEELMPRIDKLR